MLTEASFFFMIQPLIDFHIFVHFPFRMGDIVEDEVSFYSNAQDYWKDIPPTVDGMLGGYGSISSIDINGSKAFLQKFLGVRTSKKIVACLSSTLCTGNSWFSNIVFRHWLLKYKINNEMKNRRTRPFTCQAATNPTC